MLPRETSVRQLKKLRAETKGTDIGDLTTKDRLNINIPNLQYIGNPVDRDNGIESWEEWSQKDSKIQTIAFKSKLVNKSIKENKKENMKKENILSFNDFENEAAISYKLKGDDTTRISSGKDKDEATKKASKKEKGQIDPKSIKDYKKIEEDFDDELVDSEDDTDIKVKKYKDPNWDDRDIDPSYYEEYGEDTHGFDKYDVTEDDLEDSDDIEEDDDDTVSDFSNFSNYDKSRLDDEENEIDEDDLDDEENEIDEDDLDYEENESVITFEDFENSELDSYSSNDIDKMGRGYKDEYDEQEEYERDFDDVELEDELDTDIISFDDYDNDVDDVDDVDEIDELDTDDDIIAEPINEFDDEFENIKTFEAFSVKDKPKEEKQPEYTMWGKEKEPKSDPNFGIGAVKAQEIKKITDFNVIDPPTPKERTIGGNAGVFIDNDIVKGYVNRIEGKDVYVESLDNPLVIQKFSLKDVVKTKK